MAAFEKTLRLGTMKDSAHYSVYCKVKFDGKRLSITGVEGPFKNGDAKGGCGQIVDHLEIGDFAEGWDAEKLEQFRQIWERWHLNDMRPGCEHQHASWDTTEEVELVTYKLTTDALMAQSRMKRQSETQLAESGTVTVPEETRQLLALPYTRHDAPDADSFASGMYDVDKRERKAAGWIRPTEHPRGLLGKPCEVCGYKYGTAWKFEEVPADVIEWLQALPDADRQPAWV
jgi:hypothetical protein